MEKDQRSHGLTPAVKTAEFPPSSISSSSSSVVAFPAVVDTEAKGDSPAQETHTQWWDFSTVNSLISSCRAMRPLLLSRKSTWASLYLVITSTNFLARMAC